MSFRLVIVLLILLLTVSLISSSLDAKILQHSDVLEDIDDAGEHLQFADDVKKATTVASDGATTSSFLSVTGAASSEKSAQQKCTVKIQTVKNLPGKCVRLRGGHVACQSKTYLDIANEDCMY